MRKDSGRSGSRIRRILVANRGEIAIRVMRACREMGLESVAIYSDADRDAPHVMAADRALRVGPPAASASYLNVEAILDAARQSGADAIHPGYGFLSENASFTRAVEAAGLTWIGPPAATQEALGNKLAARRAVADAGVPVVPGLLVALDASATPDLAEVGFPLMLKAAAGGGGRGMRRVEDPADLPDAMASAAREAQAAFGDGTLYAERMIAPARHIEVQLLGDRHGGLAVLGERDCSVQRRHQKLVEETPSPAVTPELRAALGESARRVAGTVEFHSAATVEFLLDADGGHYFLEMNTRLQVEHGVTELVTGIDIVAWQIRVAEGLPLDPSVLEPRFAGHAIEVQDLRGGSVRRVPAGGWHRHRLARARWPGRSGRPRRGRGQARSPPSTTRCWPSSWSMPTIGRRRWRACGGRSTRPWSAGCRPTSASIAGWSTIPASGAATTTPA